MNILLDTSHKHKQFSESSFVAGYMLASLGRGLLHGDTDSVGDIPVTVWKVRLADFTALQAAYIKLYIESFGRIYTEQLTAYIPLAFPPSLPVLNEVVLEWKEYAQSLEPIYTSLRNWVSLHCVLSAYLVFSQCFS